MLTEEIWERIVLTWQATKPKPSKRCERSQRRSCPPTTTRGSPPPHRQTPPRHPPCRQCAPCSHTCPGAAAATSSPSTLCRRLSPTPPLSPPQAPCQEEGPPTLLLPQRLHPWKPEVGWDGELAPDPKLSDQQIACLPGQEHQGSWLLVMESCVAKAPIKDCKGDRQCFRL